MLTRNGSQVTVRQPYRCCYVFILAYGRIFLVNLNIYVKYVHINIYPNAVYGTLHKNNPPTVQLNSKFSQQI